MIEASGVVKSFLDPGGRIIRVLDGIDLTVPPGRVAALMGGNGSGKTTLLRILAAMIRPDRGAIHVAGASAEAEPRTVRQRTGLLTEEPGLAAHATPLWHVALHASLSGFRRGRAIEEADRILGSLGLGPHLGLPMRSLSRGQRQKVALARVMVRSTPVLLLDEPGANLDASTSGWVRREVRRRAAAGCTVLVVTHDAGEAAGICDQIHHLRNGRLQPGGRGRAPDEAVRG